MPVFIFHEGEDSVAKHAFQQFARQSGGAYVPFTVEAVERLRELLGVIAVYVVGSRPALERYGQGKSDAASQIALELKC